MKQLSKPVVITSICTACGLLCLLLRQWLFSSGIDQQGLPLPASPANILIWVVTGIVVVFLAFLFFTWEKHTTCTFPRNPFSGTSSLFLTAGYALAAVELFSGSVLLEMIAGALAIISLLCTLLIALGQFRGQRMHPLLYCPGVLFFLCYLFFLYSGWSAMPQPQFFFFQMMSFVSMLLTVFCRAELETGKISGRNYLVFSRCAVFMSVGAISGSDNLLPALFALSIILDGCQTCKKETQAAPAADAPPQGD